MLLLVTSLCFVLYSTKKHMKYLIIIHLSQFYHDNIIMCKNKCTTTYFYLSLLHAGPTASVHDFHNGSNSWGDRQYWGKGVKRVCLRLSSSAIGSSTSLPPADSNSSICFSTSSLPPPNSLQQTLVCPPIYYYTML